MRGGSSVKPGVKPWCQRAGYFCYIPNSWGDYLKKWNSSVAVHMFNWIMQSYEEWLCSWRLDLWWRSTYCMEMLLPNTRRFLVTSLEDHFPYSQWCFSSWTCYYMVVWKIYCPRFSFKSDRVILEREISKSSHLNNSQWKNQVCLRLNFLWRYSFAISPLN